MTLTFAGIACLLELRLVLVVVLDRGVQPALHRLDLPEHAGIGQGGDLPRHPCASLGGRVGWLGEELLTRGLKADSLRIPHLGCLHTATLR